MDQRLANRASSAVAGLDVITQPPPQQASSGPRRYEVRGPYRAMIGTGGIGSGRFFQLDGDHTLGREESRTGRFLDRRDYCKLHIVSHYVARLLGATFSVIPIGQVGEDEIGDRLLEEMAEAGLDLRYVGRAMGHPTMHALCLVYPDGSGGNLTTSDSASACVDADLVSAAAPEFARFAGQGIAVALPEVPLPARQRLLAVASQHAFLRVASFNSMELRALLDCDQIGLNQGELGWLATIDLLALNLDEAAALTGLSPELASPTDIVSAAVAMLQSRARPIMATITGGRHGSWSYDGAETRHVPAYPAAVVSTAGAGDAHLAGALAGLATGLSLADSHHLGALVAAMSITSPHTIHDDIHRDTLRAFASELGIRLPPQVVRFLEGDAAR